MIYLAIVDAFCIGLFLGALVVRIEVEVIARRAARKVVQEVVAKYKKTLIEGGKP